MIPALKNGLLFLFLCLIAVGVKANNESSNFPKIDEINLLAETDPDKAITDFLQHFETLNKQGESSEDEIGFLLTSLSGLYIRTGKLEEGQEELKRIIKKRNFTPSVLSSLYSRIGVCHVRMGQFDSTQVYFLKAMEMRRAEGDSLGVAAMLNNVGMLNLEQSKLDTSFAYLIRSLKIRESLNDSAGLVSSYNNLGVNLYKQSKFDQAINYYKKAERFNSGINNPSKQINIYTNIGNCFDEQDKFDSSGVYYQKALDNAREYKDVRLIAVALGNMGVAEQRLEKFDSAEKYLNEALVLREQMGDEVGQAILHNNLGALRVTTKRYTDALASFAKSQEYALKLEMLEVEKDNYLGLSDCYQKMGDYQKSLEFHKKYLVAKDEMLNLETNERIAELETVYETEKKDAQIKLDASKIETQNLEIEKSNFQKMILGIMIFLLVVVFLVFYLWYKRRTEQKHHQEILEEREKGMKAVFVAQETERKKIAQQLHDGVGQQLTGLKLAWQKISGNVESREEVNKLSKALDEAYEDVRDISHRMMPKTLQEFGLNSALEDLFNNLFSNAGINYSFEALGLESRFDENTEVNLFRVMQELSTNIIKHANTPKVELQMVKAGRNIVITVIDNGVGFDPNEIKNGIGMLNMKSRIESLGGNINFESEASTGTTVVIRVPIDKKA